MTAPKHLIIALVSSLLISSSSLSAQASISTDPVGFIAFVTPGGDDSLFGVPLTGPIEYAGTVSSVNGSEVFVSSTFTENSFNGTHYALVTSGANEGQWSEIVSTSNNSITTSEALLSESDSFKIIPFWTLSTLFVDGVGIGASATPQNPEIVVLINNLNAVGINLSSAASYFYYAGPNPTAGWYRTGIFTDGNDVRLVPETYITVRNNTSNPIKTTLTGLVPVNMIAADVVGLESTSQDNQLSNPYPVPITLATSGLEAIVEPTVTPQSPTDVVLIYDFENTIGQNISPSATYFYFPGPNPAAGWYQTGVFSDGNDVEIPAGGAFIVRKGFGDNELRNWNPPLPYNL